MCGFAGIVGCVVSLPSLRSAARVLRHRGPDDHGYYTDQNCGLVHTRLAILDLSSAGHQPMTDQATGVTIVLNGEIYNYRQLKMDITWSWRSNTDTEVILALYISRGIEAITALRGMFSFAIWDPRNQSLHLVRDRFGIKPLYLWRDGNRGIIFGSEIKAIIELGAPSNPDRFTIRRYLELGTLADGLSTFFEGIEAVAPGVVVSWHNGKVTTCRYWNLANSVSERMWAGESDTDIEERIWDRLRESIKLHLVSDVPVGIALSAGLDSQLIAHLLAKEGLAELYGFTYGFDEVDYDESRIVTETDFGIGIRQHVSITRPADLIAELDEAVRLFEAPLGGLGTFSVYRMMRLAKESGTRVLLSGEGADEVFGGYKAYFLAYICDLRRESRHNEVLAEADAWRFLTGQDLGVTSKAFLKNAAAGLRGVKAPDGTTLEGKAFLGQRYAEEVTPQPCLESILVPNFGDSYLKDVMLKDLFSLKLPKLLMFQDRAAMSHGVETRVPYLDHELVADVYSLSPRFLIADGVTKRLLKILIKRFVGIDHTKTVKRFVNAPQREWMKGPLRDDILNKLKGGIIDREGWVNMSAFEREYLNYSKSSELGNSFFVWKMLNLESLMKAYFNH